MQLLCSWCGVEKPANEFLKRKAGEPYSQKNVRCCRECNRARNRERFHTDPEVHRKAALATKRWSERNKDKVRDSQRRYDERNAVKRTAKQQVRTAISNGRLERMPCEVCGATRNVHGHHDSYEPDKWLDVRWLCRDHHKAWHLILDPMRAEGEGKKAIDAAFEEFVKRRSSPPSRI